MNKSFLLFLSLFFITHETSCKKKKKDSPTSDVAKTNQCRKVDTEAKRKINLDYKNMLPPSNIQYKNHNVKITTAYKKNEDICDAYYLLGICDNKYEEPCFVDIVTEEITISDLIAFDSLSFDAKCCAEKDNIDKDLNFIPPDVITNGISYYCSQKTSYTDKKKPSYKGINIKTIFILLEDKILLSLMTLTRLRN